MPAGLRLGFSLLAVFSVGLLACSHPEPRPAIPVRKVAAGPAQFPLEQGEVWGPENEKQVDEIIQTTLQMLIDRTKDAPFTRRDAHPKHHGCAKAFFKVDASALPVEARTGVFAPDAPKEYAAWIRFSNGSPVGATKPDADADVRGMAVKLMNVEGAKAGSQDFVLCTAKEFFSKDGSDYLKLHRSLEKGTLSIGWYMATHPRQRKNFSRAQVKPASPLQIEYFSALPYKLGKGAMRFKVSPCKDAASGDKLPGKKPSPNFLRERLVASLAGDEACFDFLVQQNIDPKTQPIEDPTLEWPESKAPYLKVATITIPRQTGIDSEAQLNFCENLSFDPWHTLPATRPLGQIGRMRAEIYPAISEYRHRYNKVPVLEPTSHDACSGHTAALCQAPQH